MPARLPDGAVRLYHRDTAEGEDLFPVIKAERVPETRAATWERPILTGSPSAEGDQYLSSWAQDDWSGGFGIEDADEGVNTSNFRFGKIDARRPHQVCRPPKVWTPTPPSGATGSALPLGDIPNDTSPFAAQFYMAWGSHAWGWDWANLAWYSTDNNLGLTATHPGTLFNRRLYVPTNASGGDAGLVLEENTAATGTLAADAMTTSSTVPAPRVFGTWSNKLWCIATDNTLWFQTVYDASSLANAAATWNKKEDKLTGNHLLLDSTHVPLKMFVHYAPDQREVLFVSTDRGLWMLDEDTPQWVPSTMSFSPHPDWGKDAVQFRNGEDAWIVAGGLDLARRTASNVEVPISGPSREQGVPPAYSGQIVSLAAQRSDLYYLVKGFADQTAPDFLEDPAEGEHPYTAVAPIPMWLGCWTGTANMCLWDDEATNGEPTWLFNSTVTSHPALWWGGTDGVARYMKIPLDFTNPRARIQLGREEFAAEGWFESVRFDGNIVGWDQIASHVFAVTDFASSDDYIDVSYRTDGDAFRMVGNDPNAADPAYRPLGRIDGKGRTLLWFDNTEVDPVSGEPWREGEPFQWIQYRTDWRGDDENLSAILSAMSVHHLKVPQDSGVFTVKINLKPERGVWRKTGKAGWDLLKGFQTQRRFVHLQYDNDGVVRGRVTGVSGERWVGGENWPEVAVITFVELAASSNEHTTVAEAV